ncbi:MAG: hypothetical protein LBG88_02850 [Christensenellaceae bacterium]|nr:hypothetical protein [Christensenellaceae bacterium]
MEKDKFLYTDSDEKNLKRFDRELSVQLANRARVNPKSRYFIFSPRYRNAFQYGRYLKNRLVSSVQVIYDQDQISKYYNEETKKLGNFAVISRALTDRDHQQQGNMTELINYTLDEMTKNRFDSALALVHPENKQGNGLFRDKLKFKNIGQYKYQYEDETETDLNMYAIEL